MRWKGRWVESFGLQSNEYVLSQNIPLREYKANLALEITQWCRIHTWVAFAQGRAKGQMHRNDEGEDENQVGQRT